MMLFLAAALVLGSAPSSCTVSGSVSAADVVRAEQACTTARARFEALFGEVAPALEIVLREQPGYRVSDAGERALVFWPTSRVLARAPSPVPAAQQWSDVLPHEAMHALVAAHFFPAGAAGATGGAAYGTPLADWFEEGVAIWAEPASSRRHRLAQARNLPADLRSLARILGSPHPAARDRALLAARDGAALPADDRVLWAFYPQALAVLSFIYDAGGAAAVRALAERLRSGDGDATMLIGLPGLPGDAAGLEAAWVRWLPASGTSGVHVEHP